MTGNDIMGLFSSIAVLMPLLLILALRLSFYKTFPALLLYFGFLFAFNLTVLDYIPFDEETVRHIFISNNFADPLLLLLFLIYLAPSRRLKRVIAASFFVGLAYTTGIIAWKGFTMQATTFTMAPTLCLSLIFTAMLSWQHIKIAVRRPYSMGKAILSASLLFGSGCYAMLFVIFFIIKEKSEEDGILVYFMATLLTSGFMTAGIYFEGKRLKRLRELKITRRELHMIYGKMVTGRAASLEAALFPQEFDNHPA